MPTNSRLRIKSKTPRNKPRRPSIPATEGVAHTSGNSDIDTLYRDWKQVALPSELLTADEVGRIVHLSRSSIRRMASEGSPGSLWAQCSRARWHRIQAQLMVAELSGFITREAAEARWTLVRMRMAKLLGAEAMAAKP